MAPGNAANASLPPRSADADGGGRGGLGLGQKGTQERRTRRLWRSAPAVLRPCPALRTAIAHGGDRHRHDGPSDAPADDRQRPSRRPTPVPASENAFSVQPRAGTLVRAQRRRRVQRLAARGGAPDSARKQPTPNSAIVQPPQGARVGEKCPRSRRPGAARVKHSDNAAPLGLQSQAAEACGWGERRNGAAQTRRHVHVGRSTEIPLCHAAPGALPFQAPIAARGGLPDAARRVMADPPPAQRHPSDIAHGLTRMWASAWPGEGAASTHVGRYRSGQGLGSFAKRQKGGAFRAPLSPYSCAAI